MPRPVRFRGRVVQAKETRGPQNKDFTRDDLVKLLPLLKGVQLMYNHGDDPSIGQKAIGKIDQAYIDDEDHLVVRGITDDGTSIGAEVFDRIRNELLDSTIPMLSIHWTAQTLNNTTDEAEKIANPDAKVIKEISLVQQGYYPEAKIMEVQCSADRLRWKTDAGIYTEGDATTTPEPARMSLNPERHDLILNKLAKLPEEKRAEILKNPEALIEMYADVVPEMWKKLSGYEQKEKRERDSWVSAAAKEAEDHFSKIESIYPEDKRDSHKAQFVSMAKDYDNRDRWQTMAPLLGKFHEQSAKLAEFEKLRGAIPAPTPQTQQMAMAASLQRGEQQEAKRQAPSANDAWAKVPTLDADFEKRLGELARHSAMRT